MVPRRTCSIDFRVEITHHHRVSSIQSTRGTGGWSPVTRFEPGDARRGRWPSTLTLIRPARNILSGKHWRHNSVGDNIRRDVVVTLGRGFLWVCFLFHHFRGLWGGHSDVRDVSEGYWAFCRVTTQVKRVQIDKRRRKRSKTQTLSGAPAPQSRTSFPPPSLNLPAGRNFLKDLKFEFLEPI